MDEQLCPERRREEEDEEDCSIDRISELPQSMLHHILCFLSQKEAIRTCLLSKSWRHLGSTRPKIEFRDTYAQAKSKTTNLLPALEQTLQRYLGQTLSVQDFCLVSSNLDSDSVVSLLEKWVPILLMKMGVRKFSLSLSRKNSDIPSVIFQAESLLELNLFFCGLSKISSTDKVMLKNLQTLSLTGVRIEEETFEKIMSSCPLIQRLVIHSCVGLRAAKVSNARNLKFICFRDSRCSIEIDGPSSLETIRIEECTNWFLYNNINMYFAHLKSLHLGSYKTLSANSFTLFSCNFPCLEELELKRCTVSEGFQLSIPSIKRLNLDLWSASSITAAIDVPNIQNFKFFGLPSITLTITSSNQWKSRLFVPDFVYCDAKWLEKLNELLEAFSKSQIYLETEYFPWHDQLSDKKIVVTYGGVYKPVVVEHLRLYGCYLTPRYPAVLNCLLHICRPRYICLHYSDMESLQVQRILRKRNNRLAETIKGERSWCHLWKRDLDEMSIEVSDENGKEWYPVQGTGFLESALSKEQQILLRLKFLC